MRNRTPSVNSGAGDDEHNRMMNDFFGKSIREARKEKGLTVDQLINLLGVKLSRSYINKVELHGEIPSAQLMAKIALALNMDLREMYAGAKTILILRYTREIETRYNDEFKSVMGNDLYASYASYRQKPRSL